ncbi:SusC/RagA family TonB-linked outer membrane protein [Pedobacter sp. N36a]|uniref:SusC/RagA family TonB-linked outer membrane protein n=1 Tax=Pedobacter sp. N36a TaxID=2767996 RepID=UPI0016575BAE|nr:SusC/RagA family TonB-linked outer membrane protein [Pedobacter sp. N36a]MBC8987037.1 SusC/RagA family TonB-linked outer membrane protein [Pedobacter sp. N36a]
MKKLLQSLFILMFIAGTALAQNRTITGTVTGKDDGLPIPGVSVKIIGTSMGTSSNEQGEYSISAPASAMTIEFYSVGYTKISKFIGSATIINVVLSTDTEQLGEVVVTGYSGQKKSTITGAVSSISGKSIENLPVPNLSNLLQGQAAGVQVTAMNGAPGQSAFVRLRGVGSLAAGSDPLFVVDGTVVDAKVYNAINANDIEQISILKDASSSAIYGARGANGLVLISTKKGKLNEPKFTYSVEYTEQSRINDNYKLMTPDQTLQYEYDLGFSNRFMTAFMRNNGYANLQAIPADKLTEQWNSLNANGADWQKEILRTAPQVRNQISLSGADGKFNYYLSLEHLDQDGIVIGSKFKRTGGRLNVTYKAKEWLSVGVNSNFSSFRIDAQRDRYSPQNAYYVAMRTNPYEPVFNKDGSYNLTYSGFPVLEAIKNNPEFNNTNAAFGSLFVEANPMKGLKLKSQMGLNFYDYTREFYIKPGSYLDQISGDKAAPGTKTDNGTRLFNYAWTNTAHYETAIYEDHHLDFLLGSEFTKNDAKNYFLSSKGFANPDLTTQNNSSVPLTTSTGREQWSLFSVFFKPSYNYQEKYFVDFSVRRDGSSRFGEDNQYGTFYSAGLAWNVTKENFMEDVEVINDLKFRASIGTSGNFNIGNYNSLPLYGYGSYGGGSALRPTQLGSDHLAWEKQKAGTVGFDFIMFDTRLTGSIDYYTQVREDLLQLVPVPSTVGFTSQLKNMGTMKNSGYEFSLDYKFIRTQDWRFSAGGNVSFNKNRITKLTGKPNESIPQPDGYTTLAVGRPYANFFLTRSAGVDPENGDALYYDLAGNVTNKFGSYAVALSGKSATPTYYGGANVQLGYKDFTLSAIAAFSGGNYIYNAIYATQISDGSSVGLRLAQDALDYWKTPGQLSKNPKPVKGNTDFQDTDRFLQKGDYVRLRDVTLAYSVPKVILQKTGFIQAVNVYVTGHNLLTYRPHYKGDPEVGIGSTETDPTNPVNGTPYVNGIYSLYSYPNYKSWTVGLNMTF